MTTDIILKFSLQDIWEDVMRILNVLKKKGFLKTKKQLKKWKVRYHELIMGKPSYDILIDDKSLNFNKIGLLK